MTKKELEEKFEKLGQEYEELEMLYTEQESVMDSVGQRIIANIEVIQEAIKNEKNNQKKKLLSGLLQEFQYIYNLLEN